MAEGKEGDGMTRDEANRIITEAMGKCWHEWHRNNQGSIFHCAKCHKLVHKEFATNQDYFTPEGFFVWFKVAHEDMDMWEEFLLESHIPGVFPEDWIGEEGTMAWAEFLKERKVTE
jgi:hypothetical protein